MSCTRQKFWHAKRNVDPHRFHTIRRITLHNCNTHVNGPKSHRWRATRSPTVALGPSAPPLSEHIAEAAQESLRRQRFAKRILASEHWEVPASSIVELFGALIRTSAQQQFTGQQYAMRRQRETGTRVKGFADPRPWRALRCSPCSIASMKGIRRLIAPSII